jgi:hypothetical protein
MDYDQGKISDNIHEQSPRCRLDPRSFHSSMFAQSLRRFPTVGNPDAVHRTDKRGRVEVHYYFTAAQMSRGQPNIDSYGYGCHSIQILNKLHPRSRRLQHSSLICDLQISSRSVVTEMFT